MEFRIFGPGRPGAALGSQNAKNMRFCCSLFVFCEGFDAIIDQAKSQNHHGPERPTLWPLGLRLMFLLLQQLEQQNAST